MNKHLTLFSDRYLDPYLQLSYFMFINYHEQYYHLIHTRGSVL